MFDTKEESTGVAELSTECLEERIVDLAARIAAATCRWLMLVAEFDRRDAHEEWGFAYCATWLAWRCSIAPRSAREHVRVARALQELDLIREAMERGELTYSKVRVLTRVATPDLEEDLVELARQATAAQLERIARAYGRAMNAEDEQRIFERRYLTYEWESDGSLSIRGSLTAEDGAVLLRALEAGRETIRDGLEQLDGSAEPPHDAIVGSLFSRDVGDRRAPVNADALVLMADSLLVQGPASRPSGERAQVVVHVDAEALAGDEAGPKRCELEDGAPISPETARRLSCDASRVTMVDGPAGPYSSGRKSRTVPTAMRRELTARDGGCRFPGCTHRRWVDDHHIQHWAKGGETTPENLVQLCRRHHRLVHEGGFTVERRSNGEFVFRNPHGLVMDVSPSLSTQRGAPHGGRRRLASLRPARGVPIPLAAGERMDLELTVWILCSRHRIPQGP
jgi:hypothetical protein